MSHTEHVGCILTTGASIDSCVLQEREVGGSSRSVEVYDVLHLEKARLDPR